MQSLIFFSSKGIWQKPVVYRTDYKQVRIFNIKLIK